MKFASLVKGSTKRWITPRFFSKQAMITGGGIFVLALAGTMPAFAGLKQVTLPDASLDPRDDKNDCSGFFNTGSGFSSCNISTASESGGDISIDELFSPVIIKFDESHIANPGPAAPSDFEDRNSAYPTVSGSEFEFEITNNSDSKSGGTWEYTPGDDDPAIKYWVAKGGGGSDVGFVVHWWIDDDPAVCSGTDGGWNADCLGLAQTRTMGSWETPVKNSTTNYALSHLTFYDSTNGGTVPEPTPLAMIALGGVLLAWMTRKPLT